MDDKETEERAVRYVKKNKEDIIESFAGDAYPPSPRPASIFMAGSPGAGKTEFSKRLVEFFAAGRQGRKVVHIDPDEIRGMLPDYTGGNSNLFQGAVSIAVDKIHDYVLEEEKDFILDNTFSSPRSKENVRRSLKRGRPVLIYYILQKPETAWDFVKKRERLEGRFIPKEAFVKTLFAAKENVVEVEEKFGDKVIVTVVEKDIKGGISNIEPDVTGVDSLIDIPHTEEELLEILE